MSTERRLHCKHYHEPRDSDDSGELSEHGKSRCPSWAMDEELQSILIRNALAPEDGSEDFKGRPKRIWNAVDGWFFVGVSVNLPEPVYNCYPETPPEGSLLEELERRAQRSIDTLLQRSEESR